MNHPNHRNTVADCRSDQPQGPPFCDSATVAPVPIRTGNCNCRKWPPRVGSAALSPERKLVVIMCALIPQILRSGGLALRLAAGEQDCCLGTCAETDTKTAHPACEMLGGEGPFSLLGMVTSADGQRQESLAAHGAVCETRGRARSLGWAGQKTGVPVGVGGKYLAGWELDVVALSRGRFSEISVRCELSH